MKHVIDTIDCDQGTEALGDPDCPNNLCLTHEGVTIIFSGDSRLRTLLRPEAARRTRTAEEAASISIPQRLQRRHNRLTSE
jgi:hypothetical protein